jgi:hypothetical protein
VKSPVSVLCVLDGFLLVTAATLFAWAPHMLLTWGLLAGTAVVTGLLMGLSAAAREEADREISDESVTTLVATVGVLLVLLGVAVGAWLLLVGVGVLLAGLVGVFRDLRLRRSASA